MRLGTLSSTRPIAAATVGSVVADGSKMKARSFRAPSPLMSPPTIGLNGEPAVARTTVETFSQAPIALVIAALTE